MIYKLFSNIVERLYNLRSKFPHPWVLIPFLNSSREIYILAFVYKMLVFSKIFAKEGHLHVSIIIFHTKNESLSMKGYHRLHLLCGESLCSERATWLKIGITALIVAMIEGGGRPGNTVQLKDPLASMHLFARGSFN